MKVAIYTRVSTRKQAEKGISLDAQESELIEYCNKNNYDYVVFPEKGVSGKSLDKREKLQELLNSLDEFDIVLCYKLSRLSRNLADIANILKLLEEKKIYFVSFKENINTQSPADKMLAYVMGICSEIERDNIREYVKMAKKQEFESGRITAKAVLGYDIVDKKLILNKKEASIVKFIFETYNKTKNYYQTAKKCNEKGFTGKKGNQFHASSIKTIIQNKIYCGFNNFHDTDGKKGTHKQIISKALYNKVNNIQEVA